MKIVITSVGSLVGQNILDALEGRRADIEIVGVNSTAAAAANFRCDRTYLAPPAVRSDAYLKCLSRILREERPDLVLPGRDDDVVVLADLKAAPHTFPTTIPVGPPALADVLDDKWASHEFAIRHSLPCVDSARADDPVAVERIIAEHGFPLIAKPRRGNDSRGVRIIFNSAQCAAVGKLDGYLLQPYLEPEPALMTSHRLDDEGAPLFLRQRCSRLLASLSLTPAAQLQEVFALWLSWSWDT